MMLRLGFGRAHGRFALSGCVLLALCVAAGCSSTPLRPLDAAPLNREAAKGSAPVHTELLQLQIKVNKDGTYEQKLHHRYRVLDKSGVEDWGYVYASYSPWYMSPPDISAKVLNGTQATPLDPKVLTKEPAYPSAPEVYGDSLVIRGPLPSVRVGSVIEQTVITRTHRAFLAPNALHSLSFASAIPKDRVEFTIDAPDGMELKFEVREAKVKRTDEKRGDRQIIKFTSGATEALEYPEPLISSDVSYWPTVYFSYGEDWGELAKRYTAIVEQQLKGVDFKSIVSEVVEPSDSKEMKIAKLHSWVKERVRYIGVEFGESSVIPYAPDETVSRGFGDCKDQATLLVGLLRAAGLRADVALLRSGTGEDVIPSLPSLDVFNHAIVVIDGAGGLWVDPTADLLPVGSLPIGDQNRLSLIASNATDGLVRVSSSSAEDNHYLETRTVQLQDQGEAEVEEKTHATGYLDWDLRASFAKSEKDLREDMKKYVESTYAAEDLGKLEHTDPTALLEPFSITIGAKKSDKGYTSALSANVELSEAGLFSWLPEALREGEDDRKSEMVLRAPYSVEIVWKVKPPVGFIPRTVPEPATRTIGKNKLVRTVETDGDGMLTMHTSFSLSGGSLKPAEVEKFRDDYDEWANSQMAFAEFEHQSSALVRKGEVKKAVELVQGENAKEKESGLPLLRLAKTLEPFLFGVAQEAARKAAKKDPDNELTQLQVGHFLSSNIVGDDLGKGYDRAGTLAAYKRASELADKDEFHAKLRHAVTLETNEAGDRYYASQEDLEKALELYASIPEKDLRAFGEGKFSNNRLVTLYYANKHEELRQNLAALPIEEVPADLAVMNEAARSGQIDAVLEEVERLNLKDEAKSTALEQAARAFSIRRLYRPAERALELSMAATKNPDRLKSRLAMTRTAKQVSLLDLPDSTPEQVAIKVLVYSMIVEEPDEKVLAKYLSRDAYTEKEESFAASQLKKNYLPRNRAVVTDEFFTDLFYGTLSATKEGSDALGYKIKINQETSGKGIRHTIYVVKEGGRYRVRAVINRCSEMGVEALSALKAGQNPRAKQWLDWARESLAAYQDKEPLSELPFSLVYAGADGKKKGNVSLEVAAATLAVESDDAKRAAAVLETALRQEKDEGMRQILLHALHMAYMHLEDYAKSLNIADALVQSLPDSTRAYWRRMDSLWRLKRYSEYEGEIRKRLGMKLESERVGLTQKLAGVLVAQEKIAEGMDVRAKLITSREANGNDYNSQAWDSLFVKLTAKTLEDSLRSVEMERNLGRLHTLATVYAEMGKLNDASRILLEILKGRKDHEPQSVDYYVLGLIAEQLGYKDAARAHYNNVEKPEHYSPTNTYNLAQKRLKAL